MLLMFYKVHIKNHTQTPTHQQKFVFCKLFKLCKNFVKKYPFRTFKWIFTRLIFFLHQYFTGVVYLPQILS